MPDVPKHRKVEKIRHEWAIKVPCDAKNFEFGFHHIQQEMQALGLQVESDDAYFVKVRDDEVVIYVDVETEADYCATCRGPHRPHQTQDGTA